MLKISGRYLDSYLSNGQITEKLLLHLPQNWHFGHCGVKYGHFGGKWLDNFSVIEALLKQESRYLPEIFSISSSHVCAKLTKKFWPLLNQPASHGPFRPKLGTPLATVFVEIF